MNAFTTTMNNTTTQKTVSNGIRHAGGIHKRRSPRRSSLNEVNFAYVDSQILRRPKTVKQTTPLHEEYDPSTTSCYSEFELDAYASNEGLFQKLGFVSSTA